MEAKKYFAIRYCCIGGIIVFGSLGIIEKSFLRSGGVYYPVLQTSLLFIGQLLCLLILLFRTKILGHKLEQSYKYSDLSEYHQNSLTKLGNSAYILSATFEFINSVLETVALNFLTPATVVSLKCLMTFYVVYYRFFHINRKIFKHQKLGLAVFIVGMIIIIMATVLQKESYTVEVESLLCIVIMIFAEGFGAANLISMEYLMNVFNTAPEVVNGVKGVTGIVLCLTLYIPFGFIFREYFTNYSFDSPFVALGSDSVFLAICCCLVVDLGLFSLFVTKTLQFTEALTVCSVESGWIFVLWVVTLCMDGVHEDYLELAGGFLIILGLFIYNEFLILPFCGLKKSAKESMEQNKEYIKQRKKNVQITDVLFLTPLNIPFNNSNS